MQNNTIILGGFENIYMKKLALYLGKRMGDQITIGTADHPSDTEDKETVWIGSDEFLCEVQELMGEAHCITLSEEESADEERICRYQSCEKLYQQIIAGYRRFHLAPEAANSDRQRWIVLTSGGSAAELLAFSVTCAMVLGERSKVLYMNFSECSGMRNLFLTEDGEDLSDMTGALRRDAAICPESYVRQMEGLDYIMPPSNPMILSELKDEDMARLIEAVRTKTGYRYVVAALGTACLGCDRLFGTAAKIFLLAKRGHLMECSTREWSDFISLCTGTDGIKPEKIILPEIEVESSGIHLMHSWQEGALGQLARIYLEGEM